MKEKEIKNLLEEINECVKKTLSEKRYIHSIGVMNKAKQLAKRYNVDVNKAMIIGLAHDIAKELSKEEKIKYVKENNIQINEIERKNVELLHAKIGADICKKRYGFTEDMQNAIKYHTTGNPEMDDLSKIIFIADKIEEGRTYVDFEKVNEAEKEGINALLVYLLDTSIKYTIDKGMAIDPDSIYTRNRFLLEK